MRKLFSNLHVDKKPEVVGTDMFLWLTV